MDLWFTEKHTDDVNFTIKVKKQLYSGKSYYQEIDVFDTYECINTYTILGTKGDYVCLKDVETGEETEKLISIICKYSDRCEVLNGDKIIALFHYLEQKFYEFKPEEINPNCN